MARKKRAKRSRHWIQEAIKHHGRVRRYLKRLYGEKAFKENGDIKLEYLDRAIEHVEHEHPENVSLLRALLLAKELRRFHRR